MICIKGLTKKYKKNVLDNVNITIHPGIFGLIGENGAGKSTLLKILANILPYNEGCIDIFGYSQQKYFSQHNGMIGYLPQHFNFFGNLTVYQAMDYIADLKNIGLKVNKAEEIRKLLYMVNLTSEANKKIKNLSGGMKQRLGIAQCFLNDPQLIILDEPTVGLDPIERLRFFVMLGKMAENKTIILSTHIINDISMMCNELAVLKEGKVVYCGRTDELIKDIQDKVYISTISNDEIFDDRLYPNIISITRKLDVKEIKFISETNPQISNSKMIEPTLEDAYFYINVVKKDLERETFNDKNHKKVINH